MGVINTGQTFRTATEGMPERIAFDRLSEEDQADIIKDVERLKMVIPNMGYKAAFEFMCCLGVFLFRDAPRLKEVATND